MSLTLSHSCWLSLTVTPSAMDLLHVPHCFPLLLAVSYCPFRPMELLHVTHFPP